MHFQHELPLSNNLNHPLDLLPGDHTFPEKLAFLLEECLWLLFIHPIKNVLRTYFVSDMVLDAGF